MMETVYIKKEQSASQFWNRQIMKVFLTMLLLPCCTVGLLREGIAELDDMEQHFEAFVAQHGRVYATVQERAHRFAIFKVCASFFFSGLPFLPPPHAFTIFYAQYADSCVPPLRAPAKCPTVTIPSATGAHGKV